MARTFVGFALVVLGVNVTIFSNSTITAIEHSVCCHIIVTCQLKIDLGLSMRRLSSKIEAANRFIELALELIPSGTRWVLWEALDGIGALTTS